jgi:hypothetical protein
LATFTRTYRAMRAASSWSTMGSIPAPRGISRPPADRQHDPVYEDGCATL